MLITWPVIFESLRKTRWHHTHTHETKNHTYRGAHQWLRLLPHDRCHQLFIRERLFRRATPCLRLIVNPSNYLRFHVLPLVADLLVGPHCHTTCRHFCSDRTPDFIFFRRFVVSFVNCDNRIPFSAVISCNMRLISSIEKFALRTRGFFAVAAMPCSSPAGYSQTCLPLSLLMWKSKVGSQKE